MGIVKWGSFTHADHSFLSDVLSLVNFGLKDHLKGLSQNLSESQIIQDKLKLWVTTALPQLEEFFATKKHQMITRGACLEQIGEQSANLTQLSILDDAADEVTDCAAELSRLQTALKTTSTMLEHHDQKIIKTLNSDQPTPLCVFSRSVKHAGLPSAKITDFSVKISDDELKAGNNTQQLISSI